jgi:hypothetical protein
MKDRVPLGPGGKERKNGRQKRREEDLKRKREAEGTSAGGLFCNPDR